MTRPWLAAATLWRPPRHRLPRAASHPRPPCAPQTLGSIFGAFSFGLLLAKVALNRGVAGISLKTLQAYLLVYVARLASILVRACVRLCGAGPGWALRGGAGIIADERVHRESRARLTSLAKPRRGAGAGDGERMPRDVAPAQAGPRLANTRPLLLHPPLPPPARFRCVRVCAVL